MSEMPCRQGDEWNGIRSFPLPPKLIWKLPWKSWVVRLSKVGCGLCGLSWVSQHPANGQPQITHFTRASGRDLWKMSPQGEYETSCNGFPMPRIMIQSESCALWSLHHYDNLLGLGIWSLLATLHPLWRKDYWKRGSWELGGFSSHLTWNQRSRTDVSPIQYLWYHPHFTMMVTFIGLVLTGIIKILPCPMGQRVNAFMGGAYLAGLIHRICAAITFAYFGVTLVTSSISSFKANTGNPNPLYRLFGPDSLCPRWKDIQDIVGTNPLVL